MLAAAAPFALNVPDDELVLRICGPVRHGQIVRLKSAKSTIGSGPRCTLRLRARGVRALHCLIVRGASRTVIRRWAPDTRLNGRAFTDAPLVPGDRLSIGPVDFLMVGSPQRSSEAAGPEEAPSPEMFHARGASTARDISADRHGTRPEDAGALDLHPVDAIDSMLQPERMGAIGSLPTPGDSGAQAAAGTQAPTGTRGERDGRRLAELTERLTLAYRQGRNRVRRLVRELRSAREEIAQLRKQEAGDADTLQARQEALSRSEEAFRQQREQWEAEQSQRQEKLEAESRELQRRQAELDARQAEFDARQTELDARHAELDARQADSHARQTELDADRPEPDAQSEPLGSGEATGEAEGPQPPIEPSERQESPSESPSPKTSLTSEEVFRRMAQTSCHLGDREDEPATSPAEPSMPPEMIPSAASSHLPDAGAAENDEGRTAGAQAGESDEESIDDYMAGLLGRVRDGTNDSANATRRGRRVGSGSEGPSCPPPATEPGKPSTQPPAPPAEPPEPRRLAPRTVAPEKLVNLTALRELANLSAQAAIHGYTRRRLRKIAAGKLAVAILALGAGVILIWIWWNFYPTHLALYAGSASLLIGLLWGIHYAVLTGRMIVSKSGRLEWNPRREKKPPANMPQADEADRPTEKSVDPPPPHE